MRGGCGAVPGRVRFLCNGGCIGFVEIFMSPCYWAMQLHDRLKVALGRWLVQISIGK